MFGIDNFSGCVIRILVVGVMGCLFILLAMAFSGCANTPPWTERQQKLMYDTETVPIFRYDF